MLLVYVILPPGFVATRTNQTASRAMIISCATILTLARAVFVRDRMLQGAPPFVQVKRMVLCAMMVISARLVMLVRVVCVLGYLWFAQQVALVKVLALVIQ